MDKLMLEGKVAIVTGSSDGIGKAIAEVFAEEGASVVMTARGKEKLDAAVEEIRAKGGKAIGIVANSRSAEDTQRVFEETLREFGTLDILVNNAGMGEQKCIDDTDDEWVATSMDANFGCTVRYTREALKIFLPKDDGRIINISSICSTRPWCGAVYSAAKAAVSNLTLHTAMRLVNTNVRCNAIAPGSTRTRAYMETRRARTA